LPAPAFGAGVRVEYLLGMGRAGAKFLLLLDINKVLSNGEVTEPTTFHPGATPQNLQAAAPPPPRESVLKEPPRCASAPSADCPNIAGDPVPLD
jgi:purine-binding chemotaxis protein CheW